MEVQRKKLLSSSRPPILKDIESVRYETIHTSSILPIKDDRSLIFEIPAQKGFYVDMRNIKIHVRYRVTRKNGSQLAGSDGVTPQSAILYSMFRDLQVNFNNRTVFWGKFLYGYYTNLLLQFKIPPQRENHASKFDLHVRADGWYEKDENGPDELHRGSGIAGMGKSNEHASG